MIRLCNCASDKGPCARNIAIFSALSDEELFKIVHMTEHKEFDENDTLCREGEISDNLFLIREGEVKICKITKEGKEQIVYILSKGDFFGENNLFVNSNISNFSAYAITSGKMCVLNKKSLDKILLENPEISIKIIEEINLKVNKQINSSTGVAPIMLFNKEKEYLKPLPNEEILKHYLKDTIRVKVSNSSFF